MIYQYDKITIFVVNRSIFGEAHWFIRRVLNLHQQPSIEYYRVLSSTIENMMHKLSSLIFVIEGQQLSIGTFTHEQYNLESRNITQFVDRLLYSISQANCWITSFLKSLGDSSSSETYFWGNYSLSTLRIGSLI